MERLRRAAVLARKTLIVDLDGVLVEHMPDERHDEFNWLPGAKEWCVEVLKAGHCLVIMTGRSVTCYNRLNRRLVYDLGMVTDWRLICGVASGQRILINDNKPYTDEPMAVAYTMKRNGDVRTLRLSACDRRVSTDGS